MTRVLIADDQEIVRTGLSIILNARPDIDVVAVAADGHEAIELASTLRPDVCLLDIRMPGMDGLEATRRLAGPDVADPLSVVIITTFDDDAYIHQALKSGARGFLLKDTDTDLLVRAIHAAAEGDALIAPSITARLLQRFATVTSDQPPAQPTEPLSDREEETLIEVARGLTNAEIADKFHVSMSTVKAVIGHLMNKIGTRNRVELAIWAYETQRMHAAGTDGGR